MPTPKITLKLKAYDHKILDQAVREIIDAVRKTDAKVAGPVPLPTKITRYTVLRSPHIDKKSREQFEIRVHKRLIQIVDPTNETVEALTKLDLSPGVDVEVK